MSEQKDIRAADNPAGGRISSSDQIVRDVVRGLYEGRYVAGQRLVEPDLMRRYHVGRSTVREALKRLAAEGVVTLHAFRGAQIRHLSRKEARDILAILEVMIGLAARLAAQNIGAPGAAAHFADCCETLMGFERERDSFEAVRARNSFYRAMTRVGGNRDLERLLLAVQVHLIRTHLRQPQDARFADYRTISEAILAGDPDAAEAAVRTHIAGIGETLDAAPDHVFAPAEAAAPLSFADEDAG